MVLEKTLDSPLDCKEIQPVHPKGDQSWVSIGRTDVEAETPILWPHEVESWLIWKDPDAGKDWRREEKGTTDDWMASPTQWICVWINSGSWWWTGRPGVLQSMGLQWVGHNWAIELNWTQPLPFLCSDSPNLSDVSYTPLTLLSFLQSFTICNIAWILVYLSLSPLECNFYMSREFDFVFIFWEYVL